MGGGGGQSTGTSTRGIDVVWLKRDVRFRDHGPISRVLCSARPFIFLFLYEPEQLKHPAVHGSHICFVNEGLTDFSKSIKQHYWSNSGGSQIADVDDYLVTRIGDACDVFQQLHEQYTIASILSHEETGHNRSYARDKAVKRWCRAHGIEWTEFPQSGVLRGLRSREDLSDSWVKHWQSFMDAPEHRSNPADDPALVAALRKNLVLGVPSDGILPPPALAQRSLHLAHPDDRPDRQRGGEAAALATLDSFLSARGAGYSAGISSPGRSWDSCSRLSPYLAWGHVSLRAVVRALAGRQAAARAAGPAAAGWPRSLAAFGSRLRWRSHFMQKFEMECGMEFQNQCRAYDGLRPAPDGPARARLAAFVAGRTGFPMVDACMRALLAAGWINFRMRAMLASFAAYNLWLDWRTCAPRQRACVRAGGRALRASVRVLACART
jgi:deoxyribodipyrimidine photo-lyase